MKLLIVDDDSLITHSLELLLRKEEDITEVFTALDGKEAIEICGKVQPDVILMDIRMPTMGGIESTKTIKEKWPHIKIMMLTTFQDEKSIHQALNAGAEGYLLKSSSIKNMAEQIRALSSGTSVLNAEVLETIMTKENSFQNNLHLEELTNRENEIIQCVAEGLSNQEIADKLYLSVGTIRNMLSVILDKLEIRDRTQLAIYYWQKKRD